MFHKRVPSGKIPRWYAKVGAYGTRNWALPFLLLAGGCMMWSNARMSTRPWTILYIMVMRAFARRAYRCCAISSLFTSWALWGSQTTPEYSRIGRMRDSYVRVFTAVVALRRLRWRKARVPLAFLAVALTCGDQDECLLEGYTKVFCSVSFSKCVSMYMYHVGRLHWRFVAVADSSSSSRFVAVGISVDGNSQSSTAVPILEGHQDHITL